MFCFPAECHQFSIFCFSSSYYTYFHLSFVQYCLFLPAMVPCYHPSNFFLPLLWYLVPETCFWDLAESAIASAAVEKLLLKALRGAAAWLPWFQSSRLSSTPHSLCLFQCSWRTCGIWWGPNTEAKVLKWDVSFSRMHSQLEAGNWVIKIRCLVCWCDEAATVRVNGSQRSRGVMNRKWGYKKKKRKQNRHMWKECREPKCAGKVTKQKDEKKISTTKLQNTNPEKMSNESHSLIILNMVLF